MKQNKTYKAYMKLMQGEYGNARIGDTDFMKAALNNMARFVNGDPGVLIKIKMFSDAKWKQVSFADTNGFFVTAENPDTDYREQNFQWVLAEDLYPGALIYHKWMNNNEQNGIQIKVDPYTTLIYIPDLVFSGEHTYLPTSRCCPCGCVMFPIQKVGTDETPLHLIIGSYDRRSNDYVVSFGDPGKNSVILPCYDEQEI